MPRPCPPSDTFLGHTTPLSTPLLALLCAALLSGTAGTDCDWRATPDLGVAGIDTSQPLRLPSSTACRKRCTEIAGCTGVVWKEASAECYPLDCSQCTSFVDPGSEVHLCMRSGTGLPPTPGTPTSPQDECNRWDNAFACLRAGQTCTDPSLDASGDWECRCAPPASGKGIATPATCFRSDECLTYAAACTSVGQECRDPSPTAVGDWECFCVAPSEGTPATGGPAACFLDECAARPSGTSPLVGANASCPTDTPYCYDPSPSPLGLNDTVCLAAPRTPVPEVTVTLAATAAPDSDDEMLPILWAVVAAGVGALCLSIAAVWCACECRRNRALQALKGQFPDTSAEGEGGGDAEQMGERAADGEAYIPPGGADTPSSLRVLPRLASVDSDPLMEAPLFSSEMRTPVVHPAPPVFAGGVEMGGGGGGLRGGDPLEDAGGGGRLTPPLAPPPQNRAPGKGTPGPRGKRGPK